MSANTSPSDSPSSSASASSASASDSSPRPARAPRLIALLAILLAAANLRTAITALAPLLPQVQDSLGIGGTVVGVLGTLPTAMFALSAFILPRLCARLTLPQVMVVALVLTGIGQLLRVAYPSPSLLFLGSLVALLAIGVLNSVMPLVVREYFPNHVPGMSISYMLSSQAVLALAPLIALPMSHWATSQNLPGWQVSLGSWALPALVAALLWLPLVRWRGPRQDVVAPEARVGLPVWRTPVGLGLALMFGSNSLIAYCLMTFLPQIFHEAGMPQEQAAGMLALWTAVGVPIMFLGPWLAGRFANVFPVVAIAAVFFSVSLLGMAYAPLRAPWLWTALSAAGTIVFPMTMVLVNLRARTLEGATALTSFGQGVGYTIACLGPLLAGSLHELTGGFRVPLVVLSLGGIGTLLAGYFGTRQVHVEDQLR